MPSWYLPYLDMRQRGIEPLSDLASVGFLARTFEADQIFLVPIDNGPSIEEKNEFGADFALRGTMDILTITEEAPSPCEAHMPEAQLVPGTEAEDVSTTQQAEESIIRATQTQQAPPLADSFTPGGLNLSIALPSEGTSTNVDAAMPPIDSPENYDTTNTSPGASKKQRLPLTPRPDIMESYRAPCDCDNFEIPVVKVRI